MAKKIPALIQLSTAELKRLLAARERIDVLEQEQARLLKSLSAVENELGRLLAGAAAGGAATTPARRGGGRKGGRPAQKTVKKTAGKTAKKATAKKATAKKTAAKTGRKPRRKAAGKKTGKAAGKVRLEDVIVAVLKKSGGTLPFKDLYAAIVDGRLFATRASNFDNVLRRTLSTSKAVKRAGRGVYTLARRPA